MSRPILPRWQVIDANGNPRAGARLYTYDTGTNTPKPTFSDAGLTVLNANPIEADSSGTFPNIFFQPGSYRVRLATAADATVWTADPVDSLGTISPFMLTLLDDTNAADARTTLGIAYATALQMEQGAAADLIVSPRRASEWIANRGHIAGLSLAINGTDANNDLDISEGVACSDAAPWRVMVLGATLTKQLDAAWAVGSGAGGLDSGSKAADTWYHVWLIRRSDTGVVDALFSTSATAPALPTGYDQRRRIGAVRTDGSGNLVPFTQRGDWFMWNTPLRDFNSAIGTTRSLITLRSPTGLPLLAKFRAYQAAGQVSIIASPDEADVAPSGTATPLNNVWSNVHVSELEVWTNASAQVAARSVSTPTLQVVTLGWRDDRGRLA